MENSKTYLAVPPGETLKELIEDRGMTQKELADRLDVSPKHVSELINGKVGLTEKIALKLESVLGVSSDFWINLEENYRKTLELIREENERDEDLTLLSKFPVSDLQKLGWIPKEKNLVEKVRVLRKFFHVAQLTLIDKDSIAPCIAFRKLLATDKSDICALCWLQKAKDIAYEQTKVQTIADMDLHGLRSALNEIRKFSMKSSKSLPEQLKEFLANYGIILVLLPSFPGSGIHGASFVWKNKIVIALSDRNKDADRFWFSLFHEIGHILNGDVWRDSACFSEELEQAANQFARNCLIKPEEYKMFLENPASMNENYILDFANKLGITPGILVGRLQFDNEIPFNKMNQLKNKINFTHDD